MPWAKFDDRFHDNPKVRRAWKRSPAAVGLYTMSVTYCAGNLTDGFVPAEFAEGFFRKEREEKLAVSALVDCELWVPVDNGWTIPDFLEFNKSRAQSEAESAKNARNGSKGGKAKAKRVASQSPSETLATRQPTAERAVYPDPTRPDPTRVSPNGETTDWASPVVVVPPPQQVRAEIDTACETLAAVGLHVHDRSVVERLADSRPDVDIVQAAINCAEWKRAGNRRVKFPLKALAPFVEADDAPMRHHLRAVDGGKLTEHQKSRQMTERLRAQEEANRDAG